MKQLMPLCSIPKLAVRDGYGGANARIFLPFYTPSNNYWFASGQQYTFPGSTIAQVPGMQALVGEVKPDTYQKSAAVCMKGA